VAHRKPKTVERKTFIVGRTKSDWPTGKRMQVTKAKPCDCDVWLSRYTFGSASRNLHISCLKELFNGAVRDHIIADSPALHLKPAKREKPIRLTPSFEQFKAIIADVRARQFNADSQDSADFLDFLRLAGLGQAEAGSLTRSDVDFEAQRIITFRHKTTTGFAVPLFPQVRPVLERL
jgi:integrase